MILSMVFLFLVLLCASCVLYYLYAFFIPALKLKYKGFNELLATNFDLDDELDESSVYNVLFPEEREKDELFDLKYRSKSNDERVCVSFDKDEKLLENETDVKDDNKIDISNKKIKCFKFWIYCYKLLEGLKRV